MQKDTFLCDEMSRQDYVAVCVQKLRRKKVGVTEEEEAD